MKKISLDHLRPPDRARLDALVGQVEQAVPILRERSVPLSPQERQVWQAVLHRFAQFGRAPTVGELSSGRTGLSPEVTHACLERLAAKDVIVLDERSGEILGAYPFSARPTRHRVSFDAQTVYAMCAVDALGIAVMLGREVRIESRCPLCGGAINVKADAEGITHLEPASAVVWLGEPRARATCCADWLCPEINFFCSDEHVNQWRLGQAEASGYALMPLEALYLASRFFAGLLQRHPEEGGKI